MKILLIEDDTFFAQRICEYLSDYGFETIPLHNTQDALKESLSDYVCAIVDIMLPNNPIDSGISVEEARGGYLAGVALTRRFKDMDPDFPVILLSSEIFSGEGKRWAKENNIPYVSKYEDRSRLISYLADLNIVKNIERPRTFIVHGHDESELKDLKDYLQNTLKWPEPVILRDQPNKGKTIIEKFEEHAGIIDYVFILITPDDTNFAPKTDDDKRRARQNVIFELGFFYGLIGRLEGRIIVLKKGEVEIPSDIHGIVWINIDKGIKASGEDIRKELGV